MIYIPGDTTSPAIPATSMDLWMVMHGWALKWAMLHLPMIPPGQEWTKWQLSWRKCLHRAGGLTLQVKKSFLLMSHEARDEFILSLFSDQPSRSELGALYHHRRRGTHHAARVVSTQWTPYGLRFRLAAWANLGQLCLGLYFKRAGHV